MARKGGAQSVVLITSVGSDSPTQGTGFVIGRGGGIAHILTCDHVISGQDWQHLRVNGQQPIQKAVTAMAQGYDLAILHVPDLGLPPVVFGDLDANEGGCRFVGYSNLFRSDYLRLTVDVRLRRLLDIQNSEAPRGAVAYEFQLVEEETIIPGQSGAPIFNPRGEVGGVVVYRLATPQTGLAIVLTPAVRHWEALRQIVSPSSWQAAAETPKSPSATSKKSTLPASRVNGSVLPAPPPPSRLDPEDWNVGRFPDGQEKDGTRLRGELRDVAKTGSVFLFDLIVERTSSDAPPIQDPVRFVLHSTYDPQDFVESPEPSGQSARLSEISSFGVFVAGCIVRGVSGQWLYLSYDIAKLPKLPKKFLDR